MTTQAERIVRVEHPETGRRYAMSEADFKRSKRAHLDGKTHEDAGYKIVSYEDGTAYEDGTEPTAYALDSRVRTPEIGAEEVAPEATTTRTRREPEPTPAQAQVQAQATE